MGRERRKRRHHAECPAQILVPNLAPAEAVAIDLSVGGAFLETGAALPLGLNVKVKLMPPGREPLFLTGRILRVGYAEKAVRHGELDYLVVRAAGLAVKFDAPDKATTTGFEAYLETLEEV